MKHESHPTYRPDIDGLRAVAVLSVVAFHAFPSGMPGGFIGVDVFFVISGFLISTILFESLERGTFDLAGFYFRRIRRIFPALLLILAVCFGLGWFILLQGEFKQLGTHVFGGATFMSNFVLWKESGYFDSAAESKPLLHLWSLGVEEQFYIVFPLLLWLAWKARLNLLLVTALVTLVSFLLNVVTIRADPLSAFYLPHIRFWELMAGALLAYVTFREPAAMTDVRNKMTAVLGRGGQARPDETGVTLLSDALSIAGAGLLAIGFLTITQAKWFPGWWALLPTLGAVLLIAAGPGAWINRIILSHPVFVWFGLISYPLYLWHWMLLAFARIAAGEVPSWEVRLAVVAASVLLAWLTYRLIETPLRYGKWGTAKVAALVCAMIGVGLAGHQANRLDGIPDRFVVKNTALKPSGDDGSFGGMNQGCTAMDHAPADQITCFQDPREAPRYVLIGDSKAGALAPGVFRTSQPGGRWLYLGSGSVYPLLPIISDNATYPIYKQSSVEIALKKIADTETIEYVVVAVATRALFQLARADSIDDLPGSGNYEIAFQGLSKATDKLVLMGKKVVLVVDNPTLPFPEDCLKRVTPSEFVNKTLIRTSPHCRLDAQRYLRQREQYMKVLVEIGKRHPGRVRIFDATDILCDRANGVCPPVMNERAVYGITDHISDYASGLLGRELNGFLRLR